MRLSSTIHPQPAAALLAALTRVVAPHACAWNIKGIAMNKNIRRSRCIKGTGRETIIIRDGRELQRSFVYLPAPVWDQLRELGITHNASDSVIIEHLVTIASASQ
jgi:hypothetical protein